MMTRYRDRLRARLDGQPEARIGRQVGVVPKDGQGAALVPGAGEALKITEMGLLMKAEIEKSREQVQNLE